LEPRVPGLEIPAQLLIEHAGSDLQQMRWTPKGAHLLLQVRVHVLNDELGAAFQRWYPNLGSGQKAQLAA
jgi:hypothetical protein